MAAALVRFRRLLAMLSAAYHFVADIDVGGTARLG
jgi:hypothetical protein